MGWSCTQHFSIYSRDRNRRGVMSGERAGHKSLLIILSWNTLNSAHWNWHLFYNWAKTPEKPLPGKLTRPGMEPGPVGWEKTMIPLDQSGARCWLKCSNESSNCRKVNRYHKSFPISNFSDESQAIEWKSSHLVNTNQASTSNLSIHEVTTFPRWSVSRIRVLEKLF